MQNIQLSIPTPCHENWSSMPPTQQGRFCNACAKQVVDFSSMSDKEVLNYFSTVKEKEVCGRAFPQQLERTIEISPDKRYLFYYRYLNYAALLLMFLKAGSVKAQGQIVVKPVQKKAVTNVLAHGNTPIVKHDTLPPIMMGMMIRTPLKKQLTKQIDIPKENSFIGYITDEAAAPIPFASLIIKNTGEAITTDSTGRFELKHFKAGEMITFSAVGYNDTSVALNNTGQTIILPKMEIVLKEVVVTSNSSLKGSVVMSGGMSWAITCHRVKDSVVKRIINFNPVTAFNPSVSIYPNPVVKGNILHVSVNFKKEGQYSLQITDAAGRKVFQQTIQASTKNYLKEMVAEKSWGSGMFIIRIADAKNNVIKTERFIAL